MERTLPHPTSWRQAAAALAPLAWLRRRFAALRAETERGTVMFVTVTGMAVVLGMGSLAIDSAQWYQTRHQAQVAADAAALAAASCLANAGADQTCTSVTDTTDARQVATTIAADNGVPASSVTFSGGVVTVTTATHAPVTLSEVFGFSKPPVTQTASANYESHPCDESSQVIGDCLAVFGMTHACGVDTGSAISDIGVSIPTNGITIKGAIESNASLFGGGDNSFGPGTLGSQCGLSPLFDYFSSAPNLFSGASAPTGVAPVDAWPVDYSKDFPACGGAGDPCNASGTPSFCSHSSENFSFTTVDQPAAGEIYCAFGTGQKSDPSTWNGNISISGGSYAGTQSNPQPDTFVGGSVTMNGTYYFESCGYSSSGYTAANCPGASGQTMPPPPLCSSSNAPSPCNYPFIYASDSSLAAPSCDGRLAVSVCVINGASDWSGDIFASSGDTLPPNGSGTAYLYSGDQSTTMVEAYNVLWLDGSAIGDGPSSGSGSTPTSPSLVASS